MKESKKNAGLATAMKNPRKLRTMPNYASYGMKDPTKEVKKHNKGLDNTKKHAS